MNIKRLRGLVALLVFVVIGVGLSFHTGTGTISSMGYQWVASVCPLGALEALLGSWAFVPRLVIALVGVAVVCFFVGKAFCSWVCPVPHVQTLFTSKKRAARDALERDEAADRALARYREACRSDCGENGAPCEALAGESGADESGAASVQASKGRSPSRTPFRVDGRHVVLGGTLVSAAIFGFPVFCLVCPIGLTVGEFILFWRFVQYNEATWALLAFPAIVVVEIVVFRRWCGTICPMGALLSLFGAANRTFRPRVDRSVCLRDVKGAACKACSAACPERIDPHSDLGDRSMAECVRCGNCKSACPVAAISFPFGKKKDADASRPQA